MQFAIQLIDNPDGTREALVSFVEDNGNAQFHVKCDAATCKGIGRKMTEAAAELERKVLPGKSTFGCNYCMGHFADYDRHAQLIDGAWKHVSRVSGQSPLLCLDPPYLPGTKVQA